MYQFVNEHDDSVNKGGNKNALGCFIPVGIDINRKKNGIGKE